MYPYYPLLKTFVSAAAVSVLESLSVLRAAVVKLTRMCSVGSVNFGSSFGPALFVIAWKLRGFLFSGLYLC